MDGRLLGEDELMRFEFDLDAFLRDALNEDVGDGDRTTLALLPPDRRARGVLKLRDPGVVSGIDAALRVFTLLEPTAHTQVLALEGSEVKGGASVGVVTCSARSVLTGERLALNLLGRLCGIATLTREFVRRAGDSRAKICDTRKTTPLLRHLEKAAVKAGGGTNHRIGLYDAVLVKDNHLDFLQASGDPAGIERATRLARENSPPGMFIQVEARTEEEALAIVAGGADSVLFDNFTPDRLRTAVARVRKAGEARLAAGGPPLVLEASGGVTLDTVAAFASTGVDRISIGALTHSAKSLDVTLDIEKL
jgi:nicotinate-nucleotide pyrophosphorylase (carboxylating)